MRANGLDSQGVSEQPTLTGRCSPTEDLAEKEGFLRDALSGEKNERKIGISGITGGAPEYQVLNNKEIKVTPAGAHGANIPGSLDPNGCTLKMEDLTGSTLKTVRLDESSKASFHTVRTIAVESSKASYQTVKSIAVSTLGVPTIGTMPIPPDTSGGFNATWMTTAPVEVPWCIDAEAELSGLLIPFLTMERRRMRRYQHGRLRQRGLLGHLSYALQLLLVFTLVVHAFAVKWDVYKKERWIPGLMTAAMILVTLFYTCFRPEHMFAEWVRMEIFVFVLWLVWEYDREWHEREDCFWWRGCASDNEKTLFVVFGIAFGIMIVLYILRKFCMPVLLDRCLLKKGNVHTWWKVKPISRHNSAWFAGLGESQLFFVDEENDDDVAELSPSGQMSAACFSYRPSGWLSLFRAQFGYVGEKDSQGRPHGKGIWFDNSFHGECLRGNWIHGEPKGTFTSREYGTGAQFAQRPIAYATSRGDCPFHNLAKTTLFPIKDEKLRYGLAQVEVSYAGGFYKFLPMVDKQHHKECASVGEVMKQIRRLLQPRRETKEVQDLKDKKEPPKRFLQEPNSSPHGIQSHASHDGSPMTPNHSPSPILRGFGHTKLMTGPPLEALVFIHGFNVDLQTALGRMGQLCALGNMAPHIVPFVFSYSGGSAISYFSVKRQMHEYAPDLKAFFQNLGKHFKGVHIIGHSAGAEFFFMNFPALVDCFAPVPDPNSFDGMFTDGEASTLPRLRTVTMINGDVLVSKACARLPEIMRYCERFTTYNDTHDDPLFWSEFIQTYFPSICCLRWLLHGLEAPPEGQKPLVLGKTIAPMWTEKSADGKPFVTGPLLKMLHRGKTSLRGFMQRGMNNNDLRSLVPNVDSSKCDDRVDIIDCSTIDQNVHKMRHFYYMLNTQVVEDICDLIVNRTPARDRSRLVRVESNVFNFLCPPANLVEI